ncbi:MAG TPA: DUF2934 domain-containing protein [Candidatus Acidoferrales bacterium]|nr:DUF2934 domain-containing protein [Candidatus Acidoferrales bacterium]
MGKLRMKGTGNADPGPPGAVAATDSDSVAALAYRLWQERGCPEGSPEEDWFRAERELHTNQVGSRRATR